MAVGSHCNWLSLVVSLRWDFVVLVLGSQKCPKIHSLVQFFLHINTFVSYSIYGNISLILRRLE